MRTLSLAALALGLATATAHAQGVPGTVHFTGRLTTAEGAPVDGTRDVVVRLFDAPTGGGQMWIETHDDTRFTQGLVYLTLGATAALDTTVLDGGMRYLEIAIDGTAMTPRLPLASVPYALRADAAALADNATTADTAGDADHATLADRATAADLLGTWSPADVITRITAGSGLTGGGTGNTITVGLQPCSTNQVLLHNGAGWTCAAAATGDIESVTPGPGINGGGMFGDVMIAINFAASGGDNGSASTVARGDHVHDARYFTEPELANAGAINSGGNPVDWSKLKGVPGGLADGVDADTVYSNGAGLNLTGTQFSAAFTTAGGDNGAGTTIARGDHAHDGRYPIQAGRPGGQILYGGTGLGEDLYLRSTSSGTRGEVYLGDDGSWVSVGGGSPSAVLDVAGEMRTNDIIKVGAAAPVAYERSSLRYIVEAPPASVGVVVPLDNAIVDLLCRDRDGCEVSMAMVNWDQPGQPGNAAHRQMRMFLSESSRWWRFSDNVGEPTGLDGANGVQEINAWDCYFGDAETYTGVANGRADATAGWGLLNCAGCNYSDATTTCRVIIED